MISRSHLMARPKEQLKDQLLMNFRKKKHTEELGLTKKRQEESEVFRYSNTSQNCSPNIGTQAQFTRSILDQFSKCPLTEEEANYNNQSFLNNFIVGRTNKKVEALAKTSVSVQTERLCKEAPRVGTPLTQTKVASIVINPHPTTPIVTKFDARVDRSIIDVSANISSLKFIDTNRILSDSMIEEDAEKVQGLQERVHNNIFEQAAEIPQQSGRSIEASLPDQEPSSSSSIKNNEVVQIRKQPTIKKVNLSKLKQKRQSEQKLKQTINKVEPEIDSQGEEQKIEKLMQKKSSIKNLIISKAKESKAQPADSQKQKTLPATEVEPSKWEKAKRASLTEANTRKFQEPIEQYEDPNELLPAYDTSSSGLQAVIQQENQSEMEESVKHRTRNHAREPPASKAAVTNPIQQPKVAVASQAKSVKSLSIADMSLADVSEIENMGSFKKIKTSEKDLKDLNDILPDDSDSQNEDRHSRQQKSQIQKYIIDDIQNDLMNLRTKMISQAHVDSVSNQGVQVAKREYSSHEGSEGVDRKVGSMLDFFDEVHHKIDFGSISKDIMDLRDRIQSESNDD